MTQGHSITVRLADREAEFYLIVYSVGITGCEWSDTKEKDLREKNLLKVRVKFWAFS